MTPPPKPRRHHPSSPFQPDPITEPVVFEVGARVSHDTYGLGRIASCQGDRSVEVDFGTDRKFIPLPCAKLVTL